MEYAEISDPRGICQDVTDLGRWGNGDVSVGSATLEELPYMMGLVRQSAEARMSVCGSGRSRPGMRQINLSDLKLPIGV